MIYLYKFQKEFLEALKTQAMVTIPTGSGKMHIICAYAQQHPDKQIVVCVSPALAEQYKRIIVEENITNIQLVS